MAEPSWKVTPERSVMVMTLPSGEASHRSASPGRSRFSLSLTTSVSKMYGITRLRPELAAPCGSIWAGSDVMARTSVPSPAVVGAAGEALGTDPAGMQPVRIMPKMVTKSRIGDIRVMQASLSVAK